MKQQNSMTRRGFVGMGAAGALAAGLGLVGCSGPAKEPAASNAPAASDNGAAASATPAESSLFTATNNSEAVNYVPGDIAETIDCDICVVGLGMSGLSAAVQAANNGDKVVGLEAADITGGNGTGVEGIFASDSSMQKEMGVSFDPAVVITTELAEMQMNTNGASWARMVRESGPNVDWLIEQGVKFSGVVDDYMAATMPCFHWFDGNIASVGYVGPMTDRAKELGVDIRLQTAGRQLIVEDGKVVGLYARTGDGSDIQVNAKAVILATGGFAENQQYIEERGFNWENFLYGGMPLHNGDGLVMAFKAGASNFVKNSTFNCTNIVGQGDNFAWKMDPFVAGAVGAGMFHNGGYPIWVNQDGVRFISEDFSKDNLNMQSVPAMTQRTMYSVFDRKIMEKFLGDDAEVIKKVDDINEPDISRADTIEEAAAKFGLDGKVVKETVDAYNVMCANGKDTEFGKPAESLIAIDQAPFYVVKINQWYMMSIGGIECDTNAQVVDNTRTPIPGLYAVGVDGCMLYRNVYTIAVPGTCNCNNINSGRTAANRAHEAIKA